MPHAAGMQADRGEWAHVRFVRNLTPSTVAFADWSGRWWKPTTRSVTMTFDSADLFSATRFVLEWGGEARALRPRALVESVRECIYALAEAHGIR